MKKYDLKIVVPALLLFAVLIGIGMAAIPAPPVNQQLGLYDTEFYNVSVNHSQAGSTPYACKDCHPYAVPTHHDMVTSGTTSLGCTDCHPTVGGTMIISRNCHDCHDGKAFYANSAVNLSIIRGPPGRPHHNITKNNSAILHPTFQAAYWAADKKCIKCHGTTLIANYSDGHYVPTYDPSSVTPMADFKINATVSGDGRLYGGCQACHDTSASGTPPYPQVINDNEENHHTARFWVGYQCNDCHVSSGFRAEPVPDYNPAPNANFLRIWYNQSYPDMQAVYNWDLSQRHMELRNATMLAAGDTLNGTGCQKCHDISTIHNIEGAAPGLNSTQTRDQKIPGYGHIGNNSDCNGCHQGWATPADNLDPFPGPKSIGLSSLTPDILTAGVATDATLTGLGFEQATYTTTVLVDGQVVPQQSITDSQIVVSIPALEAGAHFIQVDKGGGTSGLLEFTVVSNPTITSAELASGVLTIDGSGFGTVNMKAVVITHGDGTQVTADTPDWSDGQITANTAAAVGDQVIVLTGTGQATATITGSAPTPSLTVSAPNGDESWQRGTQQTITWANVGDTGTTVDISTSYINNRGNTITTVIASGVANSGSYNWNIPRTQVIDNNYKITVTSNTGFTDSSDNNLAIVPIGQ